MVTVKKCLFFSFFSEKTQNIYKEQQSVNYVIFDMPPSPQCPSLVPPWWGCESLQ